jgi:hypothetical protein
MYKVSEAEQRFSAVLAECGDSRIAAERLGYSASYGRALLFRLRKKGECPPTVKAKRERPSVERFGDVLADTGSIVEACNICGFGVERGRQIFQLMREELGWQAQ